MKKHETICFGVIGLNHEHIYDMVSALVAAGARPVSFYAAEAELAAPFQQRYPDMLPARSPAEVLEDDTIQLIVSAAVPNQRAPLGIQAMRHGKDFLVDKPGFTTLQQLAQARRTQAETGRIYAVYYGGRLESAATVRAGELVKGGAIGTVLQTIGLGPHRLRPRTRPDWFFDREQCGGILADLATHQMDQFLFFTGSTEAEVVAANAGNLNHPAYPGLEDFGDAMLRGNRGLGYLRVDWFTPDGLATWGDTRLIVLGTDGYIEVRHMIDIDGQPGGEHLLLVDQQGTRRLPVDPRALPFAHDFLADIAQRTETAMRQAHCFLASELALQAQAQAKRLTSWRAA